VKLSLFLGVLIVLVLVFKKIAHALSDNPFVRALGEAAKLAGDMLEDCTKQKDCTLFVGSCPSSEGCTESKDSATPCIIGNGRKAGSGGLTDPGCGLFVAGISYLALTIGSSLFGLLVLLVGKKLHSQKVADIAKNENKDAMDITKDAMKKAKHTAALVDEKRRKNNEDPLTEHDKNTIEDYASEMHLTDTIRNDVTRSAAERANNSTSFGEATTIIRNEAIRHSINRHDRTPAEAEAHVDTLIEQANEAHHAI
jgi:hypothetical protein